ncbi:hypothetical protein NC796_02450 [Aliifodinibius sp. S!AR15-10]|nr:hypothetical protein [Aliifodinibius sp. S!AR15-10]
MAFLLMIIASSLFVGLVFYQLELLLYGSVRLRADIILMINLGVGVLVSLRNSLTLNESWTWLAPLFMVFSIILILLDYSILGKYLSVVASIFLFFVATRKFQSEVRLGTLIYVLSSFSLFIGNVLFKEELPLNEIIVWWIGFSILSVCAEELLSDRYSRYKNRQPFLAILVFMWLSGAALTHILHTSGWVIVFYILLIQALYLLKKELQTDGIGLYSYSSLFSMASYFWLAISSISGLYFKYPGNTDFEAVWIEMIFLGFVLNTLVAFWNRWYPTSKGQRVSFSEYLLIPFVLFQVSLIANVIGKVWDVPILVVPGAYGITASIVILFAGSFISFIKTFFNADPIVFSKRTR